MACVIKNAKVTNS